MTLEVCPIAGTQRVPIVVERYHEMNMLDLIRIVCFGFGVLLSLNVGYQWFGIRGVIGGIPVGIVLGIALGYAALFVLAVVFSLCFGMPLFRPKRTTQDEDDSRNA